VRDGHSSGIAYYRSHLLRPTGDRIGPEVMRHGSHADHTRITRGTLVGPRSIRLPGSGEEP